MTRQERRQERKARQRRRRIAVAAAGFVVALTVSLLVAPAMAEGRHNCEGVVSIILLGHNCESRSDHSGAEYIDNTGDQAEQAERAAGNHDRTVGHELDPSGAAAPPAPVVKVSPAPGFRARGGAPPTGWISVEEGLVNLNHVRRVTLNSADGKTFQVMATLDHEQSDVTLLTTEDRAQAQKLLQRLAANLRAKVMAR
jgi:hypothetical protein